MQSRKVGARLALLLLTLGLVCPVLSGTAKKPPLRPINLNSATSEELQQVPGIGPVTAEKILQMRKSYGAFKSVDDLLAIRGIGKKRLEKMRKYLTVGKTAPDGKPAGCSGCGKPGGAQSKVSTAKGETQPAEADKRAEPPQP